MLQTVSDWLLKTLSNWFLHTVLKWLLETFSFWLTASDCIYMVIIKWFWLVVTYCLEMVVRDSFWLVVTDYFWLVVFVDRPLWPSLTICYPPIGPRPGRTNPLRSVLHAGNKVDLCQITDIRNKAVWVVIFVWGGGCRLSFLNYYSIMYKFRDVYKINKGNLHII